MRVNRKCAAPFALLCGIIAVFFFAFPALVPLNGIPHVLPVDPEKVGRIGEGLSTERPFANTPTARALIREFSDAQLGDWGESAKVAAPRILLARAAMGRDAGVLEQYILGATALRASGSSWGGVKRDYDFTEVTLCALLYLYGDQPDRLTPASVEHIVDVLLIERGGTPRLKVPMSFGLVYETENHLLMTESARYLRNQWLYNNGHATREHNNEANGLGQWLAGYLNGIYRNGFREFNSVPYEGYAIQALLNLEAFPDSPEIRVLARAILDDLAFNYAYGSMGLRRCVPHRRQWKYGGDMSLTHYPTHPIMQVWTSPEVGEATVVTGRRHQGMFAAVMPYRPPQNTIEIAQKKPHRYFMRVGHGAMGSPEIYSGGPGYLLSAGGSARGRLEEVVARPTALLLDDGAPTLEDCIHLPGAGDWRGWNNTGVYKNFACGNAPVHIPAHFNPAAVRGNWKSFSFESAPGVVVLTYSRGHFGLVVTHPMNKPDAELALTEYAALNPDDAIVRALRIPDGGHYEYDVNARAGTWVIMRENGEPLNRAYDTWPVREFEQLP